MRQEQKKIMEQYHKLKKKKPKKAWFDTTQRKVGMLKFDIIIIISHIYNGIYCFYCKKYLS